MTSPAVRLRDVTLSPVEHPCSTYLRLVRPAAAAAALLVPFLLLLLNSNPASALQSRTVGSVTVERGQSATKVSTALGDVRVFGSVEGNVRAASGDVLVEGPVGGNVKSGMGDVRVKDSIGGNVDAGVGDVYIDGPVEGNVKVERGNIHLGPNAEIDGDVSCGSGSYKPSPEAVVHGRTLVGPSSDFGRQPPDDPDILGFVGWFFAAVLYAGLCVLATVILPRPLSASSRMIGASPGWSVVAGAASVVAALVLFTVLLVSGIGIPLLVLAAPVYLAFVFFGSIVLSYFVGRKIVFATRGYRAGNVLAAIVGGVLLSLVYFLPLGFVVFCALALFGAGAAIMALYSHKFSMRSFGSYRNFRDRS